MTDLSPILDMEITTQGGTMDTVKWTRPDGEVVVVPQWYAEMRDPYFRLLNERKRAEFLAMMRGS